MTKTESASVVLLMFSCGLASAQNTGKARESQDGFQLEEIIVTARKVQENLQDTPISITAFTGDALERRQIFNGDALDQVTPNLSFSTSAPLAGNNASSTVFIRGIGQTDPLAGVDPGVGIYIDDVYVGQSVGGNFDFMDIAGLEVLRGPQGTLFGRNTIGGAVTFRTVDPGDEFGGTANILFGSDSLVQGFVALNVPISDALSTRWSVGTRQRDGYVIRTDGTDLGDDSSTTFRGTVLWEPSEKFRARLSGHFTDEDENGSPLVFAAYNESATFGRSASVAAGCPGATTSADVPQINDPRCANDFQNAGEFANNGTFPLESTLESSSLNLSLDWELSNNWSVRSITSKRDTDWTGNRDADNTPLRILHTAIESEGTQFSQELQLIFQNEKLKGIIGAYYFDEKIDDIFRVEFTIPPGINNVSNDNGFRNDSTALFSQWTYEASDKLSLTGGVRRTEETKGTIPFQFEQLNGPLPSNPSSDQLFAANQLFELDFNNTSFMASAQYRFNDKASTYLSYTEAFKGGGFNSRFVTNEPVDPASGLRTPRSFLPETAEAVELGFKTDLLDGRLRLNGAIFNSDYTDQQFTFREGIAPFLANAGEASISGAELEWTYIPVSSIIIEGGVGYLDAQVDQLDPLVGATSGAAEGNDLPFAPEITFNTGISYETNIGKYVFSPRIDASYQSETFFDAANTQEIAQLDGYWNVNASATFSNEGSGLKFVIGVNNLTDEAYRQSGFSSLTTGSGYAEVGYARPRELFISASKGF